MNWMIWIFGSLQTAQLVLQITARRGELALFSDLFSDHVMSYSEPNLETAINVHASTVGHGGIL